MEQQRSIKGIFAQTNHLMLLLALIPLAFSVVLYTRQIYHYQRTLNNIEEAKRITSTVDQQVLEEMWDLVFGMTTVTTYEQSNAVNQLGQDIQHIKENISNPREISALNVAINILGTIDSYNQEILSNIAAGNSVDKNEAIMTEVDALTKLLSDRLTEFVKVEIDMASERNQDLVRSLIALTVIEGGLMIVIIWFVRRNRAKIDQQITQPMHRLVTMTEELAGGNLQYRLREEPPETAELAQLTNSLNNMADDLNELLEENALKQYHLAQSEVRVLQAQITPHFIYNSLDAIVSLIEQGDYPKASEMTYALSDFFRISLSKGQDWIAVEREIKHVQDYLTILQIRYGEMLAFTIDIAPQLLDYQILKMVLQPLVENAVYHGTKFVRRGGKIEITGVDHGAFMVFTVADNGIGMTTTRLKEIKEELAKGVESDFSTGYGLYNVNKRLLLYYGKEAAIQVTSVYRKGTTITIRVPKKREGSQHDV